jgi:hypothetical protein
MTRTGVKGFLAVYFLVLFGAVFLRIDYFPLTWVPMYSLHRVEPTVEIPFGNEDRRDRGFAAQRANGEQLFVSAKSLNIPDANFRRLYHQRAFNRGPPQDNRERYQLSAFNRWWYERLVGPDPLSVSNYPKQLLDSVNRTMGHGPEDPRRIVRMQAELDFARFTQEQLRRGELMSPQLEKRISVITEDGTLLRKGDDLARVGRAARTSDSGEPSD